MALLLQFWPNYTSGCSKLSRKSENAVRANRVLRFVYDLNLQYVFGNVRASVRDRNVTVEVRVTHVNRNDLHECRTVHGYACQLMIVAIVLLVKHISLNEQLMTGCTNAG